MRLFEHETDDREVLRLRKEAARRIEDLKKPRCYRCGGAIKTAGYCKNEQACTLRRRARAAKGLDGLRMLTPLQQLEAYAEETGREVQELLRGRDVYELLKGGME